MSYFDSVSSINIGITFAAVYVTAVVII